MKVNKIVITGAVALALMAGGTAAGAAMLAGPIDSSGTIHGCYYRATATGSHQVVLQNTGTRCPSGTTPISWPGLPAGYQSTDSAPVLLTTTGSTGVASVHLPQGDFFMTATVDVNNVATAEGVSCVLKDGLGHAVGSFTGSVTLNNTLQNGEIAITGFTTTGGTTTLSCQEFGNGSIVVTEAVVTAIPVSTVHKG